MARPIIRNNQKRRPASLPVIFRQNADDERLLQAAAHAGLTKLRHGEGDDSAWNTIVCRINIGMTLAHWHYTPEIVLTCRTGLDAMVAIQARFNDKQQWGISGDEFSKVSTALILTDDMQLQVTRRQLAKAIVHVYKIGAIYK